MLLDWLTQLWQRGKKKKKDRGMKRIQEYIVRTESKRTTQAQAEEPPRRVEPSRAAVINHSTGCIIAAFSLFLEKGGSERDTKKGKKKGTNTRN